MLPRMSKASRQTTHPTPRQIIGLSLDPDLATEVKTEAARRGMSMKELFKEMWLIYKKTPKPKSGHGG
jgi:hypothetical protein